MPSILPRIDKVWQFAHNKSFSGSSMEVSLLLDIKNTLKGFANSPWTVRYSCNSTVAGTAGDGVDRWLTIANLVRGVNTSSARSWIVLRQAGLAMNGNPGVEMLIDYRGANNENADIWFSWGAGFTGGTTTARPTATDEVQITVTEYWTASGATATRMHVQMSTDGQCTRIFLAQGAITCGLWIIDRIKNSHPSLLYPAIACVLGSGNAVSDTMTIGNFVHTANLSVFHAGVQGAAFMTSEGCANLTLGELFSTIDDLNYGWSLSPIGIACNTSQIRGRYGQLFDIWLTSTGSPTGLDFDETGNRELCTLKDFVVMANGETLQVQ